MPKTIALIGALDTKGPDFAFVKAEIAARGHTALVINTAVMGEPAFAPDIPAAEVAEAGGVALSELRAKADRGYAIEVMARGVAVIVRRLFDAGRIDGVLGMGGSAGTVIGAAAMRALPLGVPKVLVSTLASGDVKPYVGVSDVVMVHAVVDVAGVNQISARLYANAVGAVIGMAETPAPQIEARPIITASMFGNTTPIVTRCREVWEQKGYEVLVFHAVGTGGQAMESVIRSGFVAGVADITPTEWADELVGGVLTAGPTRMDAAPAMGVPQVICPGCLDMANFGARGTVPSRFNDRRFYVWSPTVTLMRTNPEENAQLGRIIAEKVNGTSGLAAFFLPLKGVSMLDAPGEEFWWPEADRALFDAIQYHRRPDIPVYELDHNINDPAFADAVAEKLLEFLMVKESAA